MRRLYRQFQPQPTTTESYFHPTGSFENSIIINHPFLNIFKPRDNEKYFIFTDNFWYLRQKKF